MRRVRPLLTTSILLTLLCRPVVAQESEPKSYPGCDGQAADTAAAKGAFQAGSAAFNEADYDRAITYWEDAYRRDCRAHALLKNLARAYELNGQFKHAILALRTYSERNPDSGETESLERRIAKLEATLEKEVAAAAPPVEQPQADREPTREVAEARPTGADEPETPEPDPGGRSALPLVFAGVGAAAAVTGGVLWLMAKSDEDEVAGRCSDLNGRLVCARQTDVEKGNNAREMLLPSGIVAGVGAGILAGGLIWYFTQPTSSESVGLTPAVAPGFAGINYRGVF